MKQFKIIQYVFLVIIVTIILYVTFLRIFGYHVAVSFFGSSLYNYEVFSVLFIGLIGWLFVIIQVRFKGKYFFLHLVLTFLLVFVILLSNIFKDFLTTDRIAIYTTPNEDTLLFIADYQGGGMHHPYYETTIYQRILPFTYKKLDIIDGFEQSVTTFIISSDSWFYLTYQEDGFTTVYREYDGEGGYQEVEQIFKYE